VTRPVPVPDAQSAAFWEAAARHVLCLARCGVCGAFSHPPDVVCDHCGTTSPGFTFTPVDGRGAVRSWTVMRQSFLPGFEELIPFVLVDVELTEQPGVRLIGRLVDGEGPRLRLGAPVRTVFEHIRPEIAVPAFTFLEDA
jgi:uncharacterized OB-fold protein